jgi:hypothetical protein
MSLLTCPNCGEELRFWDELHRCQWPEQPDPPAKGENP